MADNKNKITEILEETLAEMCDHYCKYPEMTPPEGKDENWLWDADSPCIDCPMNKLT